MDDIGKCGPTYWRGIEHFVAKDIEVLSGFTVS